MRPMATSPTPDLRAEAAPALAIGSQIPLQDDTPDGGLLERLAKGLDAHGVAYCQWKGLWSAHRWAAGHGDVDLLVDRAAMAVFRNIAAHLGLKLTLPSAERQIPGVESYFGHDPAVHRLLHLHVHYRLVLGSYWTTLYRIPIERPMLDTTIPGSPFRVPAPAYQLLLFVLRMVLRQRGRPSLSARTRWLSGIQVQLAFLEACSDREELASILRRHIPSIDPRFFEKCLRSLRAPGDPVERAALPWQLHRRLRANARRPPIVALIGAAMEKVLPGRVARRMFTGCMRFAGGGTVVALVGGDGAGKSTCARELGAWLTPNLATMRAHLGNPPRSLLTVAAGGALKLEQALRRLRQGDSHPVSHLELFRHLCTARDRFRLYVKVSRFAAGGGIAICERYPIPQNRALVGPCIPELLPAKPSAVGKLLYAAEVSYYERILPPDAVFVLRLDPELAVLRKPGEPADYVRARGRVIWNTDWSSTSAHVVDASRSLPEVLKQLKSQIWSVV